MIVYSFMEYFYIYRMGNSAVSNETIYFGNLAQLYFFKQYKYSITVFIYYIKLHVRLKW